MPRREGGREVQRKLREFVAEKQTDGPPSSNANLEPFCLGREKGVHEEYQLGSCSLRILPSMFISAPNREDGSHSSMDSSLHLYQT